MKHNQKITDAGYYFIRLSLRSGQRILRSNNERAFVMSQLQDLLGRGSLLEEPESRYRLASHIDLLAFSILDQAVHCIVFSITKSSAFTFAHTITARLQNYQSEWNVAPSFKTKQTESSIDITKLSGPYDALNHSILLHLRHTDWEYDRYSSIGFYLHDRRGDWVHLWRVSKLYEHDALLYRQLLSSQLPQENNVIPAPTAQQFVPLLHG